MRGEAFFDDQEGKGQDETLEAAPHSLIKDTKTEETVKTEGDRGSI